MCESQNKYEAQTLKYSAEGCVFALLAALSFFAYVAFFSCCKCLIQIISKYLKKNYEFKWVGLWIKHISNGMSLMPTLYAYSLQPVLIDQRSSEYE